MSLVSCQLSGLDKLTKIRSSEGSFEEFSVQCDQNFERARGPPGEDGN